jgi:hypothetical protein
LSTEGFYHEFPSRSVPADIHGILMRVASLEDTLQGKIKDLADIARLVESHPTLWDLLGPDLKEIIQRP